MTQVWRALRIGLLLACVGGCSVQLAYNNLDRLARWSMDDYIEMDDAQRAFFDARFEQLWAWHRREHLPRYADYLDDIAVRFVDRIDEDDVQALVDQAIVWFGEVEARGAPVAAELLASLSDQQLADLAVALEAGNIELAEPEVGLDLAAAQARWADEFTKTFTRFTGRLTSTQRAYLDQRAGDYRPELVLWANYRRRWQADFLALLAFNDDLAGLESGLLELSANRELYFAPELAAAYDNNNALAREMSVWLLNSLSERQQQRFVDRVGELADDLRDLAGQRAGDPVPDLPCLLAC